MKLVRGALLLVAGTAIGLVFACTYIAYTAYFPSVGINDNNDVKDRPTDRDFARRNLGGQFDNFRTVYIQFGWRRQPMNLEWVEFQFASPANGVVGGNASSIDLPVITRPLSEESKEFRARFLEIAFEYAPRGFASESQLVGINCSNLETRRVSYVFFDSSTKNFFLLQTIADQFEHVGKTTDWETCREGSSTRIGTKKAGTQKQGSAQGRSRRSRGLEAGV